MISETLKLAREKKRISLKKLAEKTNIPENILISLEEGDFSNLPAEIFIRGYLKKISEILKLNFEEIWQEFKESSSSNKAPKKESIKKVKEKKGSFRKIFSFLPLLILILVILGFSLNQSIHLFGEPTLILNNPVENLTTQKENILISGLGPKNSYLKINGKEIYLGENGSFEEEVYLNEGINKIIIEAKNRLGKKKIIERLITRE